MERLSREKLDLATKVFKYVEQNLAKLNIKMTQVQDKLKKDGFDVNINYGNIDLIIIILGRKAGDDEYEGSYNGRNGGGNNK